MVSCNYLLIQYKIKPTVITFKFNNDEPVIYNNFMLIISRFFSGYIQLKIKEKRIDSFVKIKRSSEKSKALSNFLILDQNQLSKSAKNFLKMFRQDYITVIHKDKLRDIFNDRFFICSMQNIFSSSGVSAYAKDRKLF